MLRTTFHILLIFPFILLPSCGRPPAAPVVTDPPADPSPDRPAAAASPINLLTFNIRYGTAPDGPNAWPRRRSMVIDVLRERRYDLIGLQEALKFQLDQIEIALPGYTLIGVGRDDGREKGEYAPLLVRRSRFEIVEYGHFWLSESPEEPGSIAWDAGCTRICTWARLRDRGNRRELRVYNTHLDHKSQLAREKAIDQILLHATYDEPMAPTIVMGDFNAGEENPAIETLLSARLVDNAAPRDADSDAPTLFYDTFRSANPTAMEVATYHNWTGQPSGEKIDHIFATREFTAKSAEILRDHRSNRFPSDHFPVRAEIEWR